MRQSNPQDPNDRKRTAKRSQLLFHSIIISTVCAQLTVKTFVYEYPLFQFPLHFVCNKSGGVHFCQLCVQITPPISRGEVRVLGSSETYNDTLCTPKTQNRRR